MQSRRPYDLFAAMLHTEKPDFPNNVYSHEELRQGLKAGTFIAPFADPFAVDDGFEHPPVFTIINLNDKGFTLRAHLFMNQDPHSCGGKIAHWLTPDELIGQDRVTFARQSAEGAGDANDKGLFFIDTEFMHKTNGKNAVIAHALFAVKNRPGLMLKVRDASGNVIPEAMIFFPGKPREITHSVVKYGEAFVWIAEGTKMDAALLLAIKNSFEYLVKPAYGKESGLYNTGDDTNIDDNIKDAKEHPVMNAQRALLFAPPPIGNDNNAAEALNTSVSQDPKDEYDEFLEWKKQRRMG